MGTIAQFAIKFAVGVFLIIILLCCCMCTSIIGKLDDKNEKHFEISKYKEKYDSDKKEFESILKKQKTNGGNKSGNDTGSKSLISKLCQSNVNDDIETGNNNTGTNPNTDTELLTTSNTKSKSEIKKRYLLFTFDNLTPMIHPTSMLSDSTHDPYDSLNEFVNIVINNCNPQDTEVLLVISSPGKIYK